MLRKWIMHVSPSSGTRCGWGGKRGAPLAVALNSAESAEADPEAGLGVKAAVRKTKATRALSWALPLVLSEHLASFISFTVMS